MANATAAPKEFALPEADESVYFIQAKSTGYIKIGYTRDLVQRLKVLQAHSGDHLELRIHANGSKAMEREIHRIYKDARVYGEWFRPVPALLANIEQLRAGLGKEGLEDYDDYWSDLP